MWLAETTSQHREVGQRGQDVLEQLQPGRGRSRPALTDDVGDLGADQLGDARAAVVAGRSILSMNVGTVIWRLGLVQIQLVVLVAHGRGGHPQRAVVEGADQGAVVDVQPGRADGLRVRADLPAGGGRREVVQVHRVQVLAALAVEA